MIRFSYLSYMCLTFPLISIDLHEKFPESINYLDRIVIDNLDEIPPDADPNLYITKAQDFLERSQAVNRNSMYVVQHFIKRVELMLEEIFKPLFSCNDYTCRFEFQNR